LAHNQPYSTESEIERAILVGGPTKETPYRVTEEHLEELGRLADTAGAEVVGTLIQRLDSPHPRHYIGEGKVAELRELVRETDATLIIFDDELSPAQGKNLENDLGTRVVDRTELILDIFATRARTSEAQMQVELAQLQYMLPRLKRMWTHLARIRGGIGFRGPGETQLETDRRLINLRIHDLRQKLKLVAQRRATQRKGRSSEFRIALVGYTNAGKSSVLRELSGSELFVENRLFATLDPATRAVELGGGVRALVTDTVGFIRKLPHHLVASFRATLEEVAEVDLVLHLIDASHPGWEEQKQVVEEVLEDLDVANRPTILVFNKIDRLTHEEEAAFRERTRSLFAQPVVFASAVEEGGLDELRGRILEEIRNQRPEVEILIPAADGETLAAAYREGEVLRREEGEMTISLLVRLPRPALGRISRRPGVEVHDAQ
jgi:GTP-binding protein HflX